MCWLHQSAQLWSYPTFLLVPLIVIGAIECFAGCWAWRFVLGVNGAVLGLIGGVMLSMLLGNPVLILLGAFAGAVAGAVLFVTIKPLGSFAFAVASMASLTMLLADIAEIPPRWSMPLSTTAGLAGGAAAVAGCRVFMIAMTAVAGAQQIAAAWRAYRLPYGAFPLPELVTSSEAAAFITLAAAGLMLQLLHGRAHRQNDEARFDASARGKTRASLSRETTAASLSNPGYTFGQSNCVGRGPEQ